MHVTCTVEETVLENDQGDEVPGVIAICSRCDHETESLGTSPRSVRRCMTLMRHECPRDEENYYAANDGSDKG